MNKFEIWLFISHGLFLVIYTDLSQKLHLIVSENQLVTLITTLLIVYIHDFHLNRLDPTSAPAWLDYILHFNATLIKLNTVCLIASNIVYFFLKFTILLTES